jgi:hypothetical protein
MIPTPLTDESNIVGLVYYVLLASNQLMPVEEYHRRRKAGETLSGPIRHSHNINSLLRLQKQREL